MKQFFTSLLHWRSTFSSGGRNNFPVVAICCLTLMGIIALLVGDQQTSAAAILMIFGLGSLYLV